MSTVLCGLEEIADPGSRQFTWGEGLWSLEFFVVRKNSDVSGFVNRCPHAGHALNWQKDRFLTQEHDLIICNSHGARFRIVDGVCVSGPCIGLGLKTITLGIKEEQIVVEAQELDDLLGQRMKEFISAD